MTNNTSGINKEIKVNGQKLETITSSSTWVSDEGSKPEILSTTAKTTAALTKLKPVWSDRSISLSSKIRLMRFLLKSIFVHACESWTLKAEFQKVIQAMEMRCYRRHYASHTKTMLPTRKFVPRSSRQSNHTKTPDHRKETQTAVVWSYLPFIRSGQNHLARHSERGRKTRQTEEKVGRPHQEMDSPGVRQVPESSGELRKMEKTGFETPVVPQRPSRLRYRRG